jgi:hypothetical protein
MSFLFPSLLSIGLPLVAVPLLIHLINLRRQQRIRWAAMQFLVESQRRNKRWILFKQLLLLAARMSAIAVLVLLLAHLVLRNDWLRLLGSGTTHHLVLLDDSYSMSDRWDNTSAIAEGKRAIQSIVDQAGQESGSHLITMLRFSEAAKLSAGAQPGIFCETINETFRIRLETLVGRWEASQSDVSLIDALKAVPRLPLADDDQTLILYVISDFRANQFVGAAEIRNLLSSVREKDRVAQIHLVRCVHDARPNLAITALEPESGVRAAGVEMWMRVTVTNYSEAPAQGVTVQVEQDGDALAALALEDVPATEQGTHKFRVQFAGTGAHHLTASLGKDAVDVDNRRYYACDLPSARPVLVIDESSDGLGGRQLSLALAPGGNTRTGWQPHVEPASFLADTEKLDQQVAVILLDVPRLADNELAALEEYVRAGGGVAFFVGPDAERAYFNERLYRRGEGLFPAPLRLPVQLVDRYGESTPDVEVTDHILFHVLSGRRNGFLPLIMVDFYYALETDWAPADQLSTTILAKLRNRDPLVVERRFGAGRVVAHLTKLSSGDTSLGKWTNWSLNPVFPVLANELVSYLAAGRQNDPIHTVGDDLIVSVDQSKYEPAIRFLLPGDAPTRPELTIDAKSSAGRLVASLDDVATSGIYEAQLQTIQSGVERVNFAVNVPTGEGDLSIVHRDELSRHLAGVEYQLHDASDMTMDSQQLAGFRMGDALLGFLVAILLIEQVLGYWSSYHVTSRRGPSKGAG